MSRSIRLANFGESVVKLRPCIHLEAEITVTDVEAEVIALLTSYDLAEWFGSKCSRTLTGDKIKESLRSLHDQCNKIVAARKKALASITGQKEGEI